MHLFTYWLLSNFHYEQLIAVERKEFEEILHLLDRTNDGNMNGYECPYVKLKNVLILSIRIKNFNLNLNGWLDQS